MKGGGGGEGSDELYTVWGLWGEGGVQVGRRHCGQVTPEARDCTREID